MSNDPHRFGDPFTPADVIKRITDTDALVAESPGEAAPYYYGRFKALLCAFDLAGELMDRPSREMLSKRLAECHARAQQLDSPRDRDVEEAVNFLLLLAAGVRIRLDYPAQ